MSTKGKDAKKRGYFPSILPTWMLAAYLAAYVLMVMTYQKWG